jgi:hypothetical protein
VSWSSIAGSLAARLSVSLAEQEDLDRQARAYVETRMELDDLTGDLGGQLPALRESGRS